MGTLSEYGQDPLGLVQNVVTRVLELCPNRRLIWIAKRHASEGSEIYDVATNDGFFWVTLEEAKRPSDELYARLATEVTGYTPGSLKDYEHQLAYVERQIRINFDESVRILNQAQALIGERTQIKMKMDEIVERESRRENEDAFRGRNGGGG